MWLFTGPEAAYALAWPAMIASAQTTHSDREPLDGSSRRAALTERGVALITVHDEPTERLLDLHWLACLSFLFGGKERELEAFEGVQLDGRGLAWSAETLGACFHWVRDGRP